MRFFVLATDYDGTIAHHGVVDAATREALNRVRSSGRKLVLVTGRELPDLQRVFAESDLPLELFDSVVAENGALVHRPSTKQTRLIAEAPPPAFVAALRERGVEPLSVGQVIVATWQPHETVVLETIRELGLELQVIFNKGAVMVLPSGINKAVGLRAALEELGLSPHNAVAVGDAENDHAFLSQCECAVAVGNALPALKERADHVTAGDHGHGVQELAAALVESDLATIAARLDRHRLEIGTVSAAGAGRESSSAGDKVYVAPYGPPVLVAGTSGGGKTTLTTGLLEAVAEHGYQFFIVDPEGDYSELPGVTVLGDAHHAPGTSEVLELLATPGGNVAVNLLGVPVGDRAAFLEALLPHLQEMRARLGRPHWLIVDEAHHVLPAGRPGALALPRSFSGVLLVTVHPEHVAPALLEEVGVVLLIGSSPATTMAGFAEAAGCAAPQIGADPLPPGEALMWFRGTPGPPLRFRPRPPSAERRRHLRKYAAGELGPDKSFYFRGPEEKLNLRVQNLQLFMQVADGVDDDTWLYHLQRGDYSRWFRDAIKDPDLAAEAATIEKAYGDQDAGETGRDGQQDGQNESQRESQRSKAQIRAAIEKRYTAAA